MGWGVGLVIWYDVIWYETFLCSCCDVIRIRVEFYARYLFYVKYLDYENDEKGKEEKREKRSTLFLLATDSFFLGLVTVYCPSWMNDCWMDGEG